MLVVFGSNFMQRLGKNLHETIDMCHSVLKGELSAYTLNKSNDSLQKLLARL